MMTNNLLVHKNVNRAADDTTIGGCTSSGSSFEVMVRRQLHPHPIQHF